MPRTRNQEAALVDWVNTFPLDRNIKSFAEITDPLLLSKILEDFDPKYAVQNLDHTNIPTKWLSKKKGLEAVYRSLLRYIRDGCDDLIPIALEEPIDIDAIAQQNDESQTIQLLTLLLLASVKGPQTVKYVSQITENLDAKAQKEVMALMTSFDKESSKPVVSDSATATVSENFDLAFEEEHARLKKEYEALRKHAADLVTRNDHLKDNYDQLVTEKQEVDRELESLQKSSGGDRDGYIDLLKTQISENDTLIAEQEEQLELARVVKEKQTKELERLRGVELQRQNLEDELATAKVQIVQLSKKANTVDHYQQKLQLLTATDEENATLRRRIDTLESNQKAFDEVFHANEKLKSSNAELTQRFHAGEQEIVILTNQKRTLENDIRARDDEIDKARAEKLHDEEFIKDLQNQAVQSSGLVSPSTPSAITGVRNLEDELNQSEHPIPNYELELSRLRAENNLLRSNTAGTTNASLRIDLEASEKAKKQLQSDLQAMSEKYAIGQRQLDIVISDQLPEEKLVQIIDRLQTVGNLQVLTQDFYREQAVASIRKLYHEANEELKGAKKQLAEMQAELTSRDRELLEARTDLSAIGQEDLEALGKLKATNEIVNISLHADLMFLQHAYNEVLTDVELQKQELAGYQEKVLPQAEGAEARTEAMGESVVEQVRKMREQIEKQDELVKDLQRRLKHAEEQSPDAQKAANEIVIKNLTRENLLISTAWYDLTSRLQSNHVVLQRRQDAPRGWLNKQRQLVNATPRR